MCEYKSESNTSFLLCWPTTLEANAGDMTVILNLPAHSLSAVDVRQIAAEDRSGKMASDMEVSTKQKYAIEFLHARGGESRLLNIYETKHWTLIQWDGG
jgi:hypothetical protein